MRKTANRLADGAASVGYANGWNDAHTADEVMSLAIAASVLADATHDSDVRPVERRANRWKAI